jgi:uncharacterized protein
VTGEPADYRDRPRPLADNVSRPYWDGLRDGVLRIQGCEACGTVQFYPRPHCLVCGGQPVWHESTGRGTVHTYTVIRQNGALPFRDQVPYVVAIVDVDPGVRMMGNVVGIDPDDVRIGLGVELQIITVDDDYAVPVWRVPK